MTRMTKDETKLLAQAAVIVDSLLPWKKLSATFDKKQLPKTIEPEHSLLDAAALSMPETLVSAELLKDIKKARKTIDEAYDTQVNVWYNELATYINTPLKSDAHEKWFTELYKNYWGKSKNGLDDVLDAFSESTVTPPKNVNHAKCKDIFQRAYSVIRRPESWTQGAYSRTVSMPRNYALYQPLNPMIQADGSIEVKIERQVYTNYETHRQFCSAGALLHADGALDERSGRHKSLSPEALFVGGQLNKFMHNSIARFNDSRPHNEVVRAWERCGSANGWL